MSAYIDEILKLFLFQQVFVLGKSFLLLAI